MLSSDFHRSIALRKTKTLGLNKRFKIVQAGDYRPPLPGIVLADAEEAEDEDGESTASLPPFERLVLWTDPTDEENTVEVQYFPVLLGSLVLSCLVYLHICTCRWYQNWLQNCALIKEKVFNFCLNVLWECVGLRGRVAFWQMTWD